MKGAGADYRASPVPFKAHIERDANLITGQNPQSSALLAREIVKTLAAV